MITLLPSKDVDFMGIAALVGDKENQLCTFYFDNFARVTAKRKVRIAHGLVKSKYLHITITHPSGHVRFYREQKNGTYLCVGTGHDQSYKEVCQSKPFNPLAVNEGALNG